MEKGFQFLPPPFSRWFEGAKMNNRFNAIDAHTPLDKTRQSLDCMGFPIIITNDKQLNQ